MPFGAMELVQDNWIYGEMFCLVRTSLDVLLTTASILHLCCISLDRYKLQRALLQGSESSGLSRATRGQRWTCLEWQSNKSLPGADWERILLRAEQFGRG